MTPLYAGLVVWLVTLVLVEGFVFEGWRDWLRQRTAAASDRYDQAHTAVLRAKPVPSRYQDGRPVYDPVTPEQAIEAGRTLDARLSKAERAGRTARRWHKVAYLFHCHLCLGLWIGWAVALVIPGPLPHFLLNGLLYKAVGHVVLEVTGVLQRVSHGHAHPPEEAE